MQHSCPAALCKTAKLQSMAAWRIQTPACYHQHMYKCKLQPSVTTSSTAGVANVSTAMPNNHP